MSNMNYLDVPVLRSYGFQIGASGSSWFGTDCDGNEWRVTVGENMYAMLRFENLTTKAVTKMSRDKFSMVFNRG